MSVANQSIVINYSPASSIQDILTPLQQMVNNAFTQGVVYNNVTNNSFIAQTYTLGNNQTQDELMTVVIGIEQNYLYMQVWEDYSPPGSTQTAPLQSQDPGSPYNVPGMTEITVPTGSPNGVNITFTSTFNVQTTMPVTGEFIFFNTYGSGGVVEIDGTDVGSSTNNSTFSLNSNITLAPGTHTITATMALQANYTGQFYVAGSLLGPNNVPIVWTNASWQSNSAIGTVSGNMVWDFNPSYGANSVSGVLLYFGESGIIWASANQGYIWFNSKSQYGTQETVMACGLQRYTWDTLDLYAGPGIVNKTKRYGMMMGTNLATPILAGRGAGNYPYYNMQDFDSCYGPYFSMLWPTGYDSPVYWPDDQYNQYMHYYMNGFPRDWATINRQDPNHLELLIPTAGAYTNSDSMCGGNNSGSYANTGPTYYQFPGVLGVGLFTTNVTSESVGPSPTAPEWIVLPTWNNTGINTAVFPWSSPTAIAV